MKFFSVIFKKLINLLIFHALSLNHGLFNGVVFCWSVIFTLFVAFFICLLLNDCLIHVVFKTFFFFQYRIPLFVQCYMEIICLLFYGHFLKVFKFVLFYLAIDYLKIKFFMFYKTNFYGNYVWVLLELKIHRHSTWALDSKYILMSNFNEPMKKT